MTDIYRIEGPWTGELAIIPRPRGGDWLDADIHRWRENNIDVVVSLLTPSETVELVLQDEQHVAEAKGIHFYAFPINDRGVPPSLQQARTLIEALEQALTEGYHIGIHCRHGIGRSALLAAALLVQGGVDPDSAFTRIETARGRPVPDTGEQRAWVEKYAAVSAMPVWS